MSCLSAFLTVNFSRVSWRKAMVSYAAANLQSVPINKEFLILATGQSGFCALLIGNLSR